MHVASLDFLSVFRSYRFLGFHENSADGHSLRVAQLIYKPAYAITMHGHQKPADKMIPQEKCAQNNVTSGKRKPKWTENSWMAVDVCCCRVGHAKRMRTLLSTARTGRGGGEGRHLPLNGEQPIQIFNNNVDVLCGCKTASVCAFDCRARFGTKAAAASYLCCWLDRSPPSQT